MREVTVYSFGFKAKPTLPQGCTVIDLRNLRNPHSVPSLRSLDGRRRDVQLYVMDDPSYEAAFAAGLAAARTGPVAFGCMGGRHRSVVLAERLSRALRAVGVCVTTHHLCL